MEVMDMETKMQRWNCDMKDFSPRSNQASNSDGLFFAVTCADAVCRSVKRGEIVKEILMNEAHAFCLECAQCFQKNRYTYIYIYRDALCLWSLKICHKTDARKMLATQISSREEYSREAFTKCNCARLLVLFSSRKCFNKVICAFCWICRQQSNSQAISKYGGKRGATEATETRAWETIWECSKTERGTMISLSIYRNLPYWLIFHQHDNT